MTQFLQLPAECGVPPHWPDLAHLIAGTPAWQRDRDRAVALARRPRADGIAFAESGLAESGVALRVASALVAVPLAGALLGSVVLLFASAGA